MGIKERIFHGARIALIGVGIAIITLSITSKVYAQESPPSPEHGACISCHEDLYFLHDTGKWFCLRESPMQCVDCHGGDPNTFNQEQAHSNREPHPILDDDVSKCRECHPEECDERVKIFESTAGISDVLVSAPLQTKPNLSAEDMQIAPVAEPVTPPAWISFSEVTVLVLITGLAFAIYFFHKRQHRQR